MRTHPRRSRNYFGSQIIPRSRKLFQVELLKVISFLVGIPLLCKLFAEETVSNNVTHLLPAISMPVRNLTLLELGSVPDVYLVSAFYDYRYQIMSSKSVVKILGAIHRNYVRKSSWKCYLSIKNSSTIVSFPCDMQLLPENHGKPFYPAYFRCEMTAIDPAEVEKVTIHYFNDGEARRLIPLFPSSWVPVEWSPNLPHEVLSKLSNWEQFVNAGDAVGVCIAPIRGDIYAETIKQFYNYHKTLISEPTLFAFYNTSAGKETSAALAALAGSDVVVINWEDHMESSPLLETFDVLLHANGQVLAINDCLLRFMGKAKWVGIFDLDEFVVPRCAAATTLSNIFKTVDKKGTNAGGYMFNSAFFFTECKEKANNHCHPLDSVFRGSWFTPTVRSKMFVNPWFIEMEGIHFPDQYMNLFGDESGLSYTVIPVEIAALHHYRYLPPAERYKEDCVDDSDKIYDPTAIEILLPLCLTPDQQSNRSEEPKL